MLIIGQKTAKYYAATVSTKGDYITYATVGKKFDFFKISEKKNFDLSNKLGKSTRTYTIRTDAKLNFKESDKIIFEEKEFIISEVNPDDSVMTSILENKLIVMVG